jgi:ADP-ribose pyrophosphatase YjhB (NUDIX family)
MDKIHVTVAAIIKRNEQYLLVKEKASSGDIVFNQPAGHVELKESIVDAIIREVHEETGLDFTPTNLIGTYLLSPATNGKTYLRFCFNGTVPDSQQPSPNDPDIIENCWFSLKEITELSRKQLRSALVLKSVHDHLNGTSMPLECLQYFGDEHGLADVCYDGLNQ